VPPPPAGSGKTQAPSSPAAPLGNVDPTIEYDRLIRSQTVVAPLDSNLLGESVDYYTGQTDFVATDVNLPTNSELPMPVTRRYHVANHVGGVLEGAFGDWDLDVPHIEGVVAQSVGWTVASPQPLQRCNDFGAPPAASVTTSSPGGNVTTSIPASEYAPGYSLVIPGQGRHELLQRASGNTQAPGSNYPVVTHDWWAVTCTQRYGAPVGTPDEAFQVTSPSGVTYSFIYYFQRDYPSYQRIADTRQSGVTAVLPRWQVFMLPDTITDRFGNWIKYNWKQDYYQKLYISTITSSDGHTISFYYSNYSTISPISQIADNTSNITGSRVWNYSYTSGYLTKVTLPDNSYWSINFANLNSASWSYSGATCSSLPTPTYGGSISSSGAVTATIQHPTGALGTFTFAVTRHGRNGTPTNSCLQNIVGTSFAPTQPAVYDVLSLTKKVISGPNLPSALTWSLAYAGCSASSCNATKTTTLTDALGHDTRYTFGAVYSATAASDTEGQLQSIQSGGVNGSNFLRTESYTYLTDCGSSCPSLMGTPTQVRGDLAPLTTLKPVQVRTITQDGATYTQTMSNPDSFGFPTTITRVGTDTKADTVTYTHDTSAWVIGTVTKTQSAGATEVAITLNANDLPETVTRFGRLDRTYTYYSDGTLWTSKDGNNNTTTFSNYACGIPQNISYPDGKSESAQVAYYGVLTSRTDPNGYTTSYGQDAMGRLNLITYPYPAGETYYTNKTITWTTAATGWTSTEAVGTYQKVTTYDAFLRPVLTNEDSTRYVNRKFDADGRTTFESYPSTSSTETNGITSAYDHLGRLSSQQDSGGNTTTYTPAANQLTVKDRDGNNTTYTFKAYDEPSTAWPSTIASPTATTTIGRDTWGKPTSFVRGSITRSRTYDANQLLQKVSDPERTYDLTFDYDGAANLSHVYQAGTLSETRGYDQRNRLTSISYQNGDPGVGFSYWPDGLLETATRGSNSHTYTYNSRRLLKSESITVGGNTYTLGYTYDTKAHLQTLTYPDTTAVSFYPNDLGQTTQVGTYATSLTYYPNGAAHTFTFGNAIAHTMTQTSDGRQLPGTTTDTGVLNLTYTYDGNGSPKTITDSLGTSTRSLTYDSANRLYTANATGLWGNTTFTYDNFDNLTSDATGGTTTSYTIDGGNNLLTQFVVGATSTAVSYDNLGNVKQEGTGATATILNFNAANLLNTVTQGATTYTYAYDGKGQRVTSSSAGSGVQPVQITSFYDAAGRLIYDTTTINPVTDQIFKSNFDPVVSPTTSTNYLYQGNHLVAKDATNGSTHTITYVHTDALGSPVAQTNASKTVVGKSNYLPYGGLYSSSGTGNKAGIGYAGQSMDPTGFVYMRARYYDPQLHRFLSMDPVDVDANSALNFNRYSYAANSPYAKYDPSGREAACISAQINCFDTGASIQERAAVMWGVLGIGAFSAGVGPVAAGVIADIAEYGFLNGFLMNAAAINETGAIAFETGAAVATGVAAPSILQNAAAGLAFEAEGLSYLDTIQSKIATQVSVRPYNASGSLEDFLVRLDAIASDAADNLLLTDFKSSSSAGFTPNQQMGYPLIELYGGQVAGGNGGEFYPAGTEIPPTPVDVITPTDIPDSF
jgi:RHS repeat-associated protein